MVKGQWTDIRGVSEYTKPDLQVPPMTKEGREKILLEAQRLAGMTDIQYSKANRTGPKSFDCSGFVWKMYEQAGYDFGLKDAAGIAADKDHFVEVADQRDARPGDLVVHLGVKDNHVGILSGFNPDGEPSETSATTRAGDAKRPVSDPYFQSSIYETPVAGPRGFKGQWRIYKWKN